MCVIFVQSLSYLNPYLFIFCGSIARFCVRIGTCNIQGNTSKTRQLIVEIGDDNGDGSAVDVVSMTSERSRSNSRSRSTSNDRSDIVSRDELISKVSSTPTGAGASTSKSYVDQSDNHKSAGQNEHVPKSDDEGLTPYDIAMKELETRSERVVRPKVSSKNKSDTGQTHSQRPK